MRETLKFSRDRGREIIFDDDDKFTVIKRDIVDTSRWSIITDVIVKRLSDGKLFKSCYSQGATESQDERPYEYDEFAEFTEVFAVEKTITVYE